MAAAKRINDLLNLLAVLALWYSRSSLMVECALFDTVLDGGIELVGFIG